jgi:predicted small metal-binding protein
LDIYCIHYVFHSVSIILVLPDNDECFQALAYGMKPNFLFYADSREEDIVSVITEMTGETRKMTTINERRVQNIAKNFATAMPHYYEDRVSNM